jgi:hypothetical protein
MTLSGFRGALFSFVAVAGLAGCNIQAPQREVTTPGGQSVAVTLDPPSAAVQVNGTVPFSAAVTGSADTSVTWAVVPGTGCGTVTPVGMYTAPGAAATCQVTATSVADPTKSASASVSVTTTPPPAVTITVAPTTGNVNACQTLTFTATVTGPTNKTVTWNVQETGGGTVGATSGIYTAPSTAGTWHVVATSNADTTKKATATVVVTTKVLSVTVAPSVVQLPISGTNQFSATVTTTCGTFASTQSLNADGTITN